MWQSPRQVLALAVLWVAMRLAASGESLRFAQLTGSGCHFPIEVYSPLKPLLLSC
jgi:hypothetical protein